MSEVSRRKSGTHGRLTVTRGFSEGDDTLILRLSQGVNDMLFAQEIFEEPIRVTVMRGGSANKIRVGIFADRRINIVREEIANAGSPHQHEHAMLPLYRRASLALTFMEHAESELE